MADASNAASNLSATKQALFALKKLNAKYDALKQSITEPIAVVGIGCRFPGNADNPDAYWRLLRDGVDAIREVPADRWDLDEYFDPDPDAPGKMYTRYGGFLSEMDKFDARFFGISPREAAGMDPQQRLLLEVSWEALEHANIVPANLSGSQTGVFLGVSTNDYGHISTKLNDVTLINAYAGTGNALSIASGRLSYFFGFQGPNVAIDTACSSSLVSVHLACQSLRAGECNLALSGGVNLILTPDATINFSKARMMAADGRCKTFDAAADGYVRGEGCGMIVLKRLSDALESGDNILALIKGSAINQDGRSNGLTAPNGSAQVDVIRRALDNAGVEPEQVGYIEAHGTGTSLGDPIEIRALNKVMRGKRLAEKPLMIGAAKTNVGHLEAAAGIAGLIKVILALHHEKIPQHLHFKSLNPEISLEEIPAEIPTVSRDWKRTDEPRIAGVSSFGFSGTNSHVILQESPAAKIAAGTAPMNGALLDEPSAVDSLLCLSAKTQKTLLKMAQDYDALLDKNPKISLADLCFSTATARSHFDQRLAVRAKNHEEMRQALAAFREGKNISALNREVARDPENLNIAFLFTGQGAQYFDMGKKLYETEPVFHAALDRCDEILREHLSESILYVIFNESVSPQVIPVPNKSGGIQDEQRQMDSRLHGNDNLDGANRINQTAYTQPALFAIEYALAALWQSWGVKPDFVLGHSVGEYAAATVAGMFTLEDGLKLIAERGRLMQSLPEDGAMAAIFTDEKMVAEAISPFENEVSIAALNGPQNIVISGIKSRVDAIVADFEKQGIKGKPLTVSHAFHSPLMEPILDDFERAAGEIGHRPLEIPLLANVNGEVLEPGQTLDAAYWRKHIRQPVRFAPSMQKLAEKGCTIFIEIGPNPTLLGMATRCLPELDAAWIPSLRKGHDDAEQIVNALGTAWANGVEFDWNGFDPAPRRMVQLPTYPFQRERYWLDLEQAKKKKSLQAFSGDVDKPLLGRRIKSPMIRDTVFESFVSPEVLPMLDDHRVYGAPVLPATAYLDMALSALAQGSPEQTFAIENMHLRDALIFSGDETMQIQTVFSKSEASRSFQVFSAKLRGGEDDEWVLHVEGRVSESLTTSESAPESRNELHELKTRCTESVDRDEYYQILRASGVEYGPEFQGIRELWQGQGEALARLALGDEQKGELKQHTIHPALLDSAFQLMGAAASQTQNGKNSDETFLPIKIERFVQFESIPAQAWCHVRVDAPEDGGGETLTGHIILMDADGQKLAEVTGLTLKRAERGMLRQAMRQQIKNWFYRVEWREKSLEESAGRLEILKAAQKPWLILADDGGAGEALARDFSEKGLNTIFAFAGDEFREIEKDRFTLNPTDAAGFETIYQKISEKNDCAGIVHLWSLDAAIPDDPSAQEKLDAARTSCNSALEIVKVIARNDTGEKPELWLVTQNAQSVGASLNGVDSAQAALLGLAKTIAAEHPDVLCKRVDFAAPSRYGVDHHDETKESIKDHSDLGETFPNIPLTPFEGGLGSASKMRPDSPLRRGAGGDVSARFVQHLVAEILNPDSEDQIAWRNGERFVARLTHIPEKRGANQTGVNDENAAPRQLKISQRGVLDNLNLESAERKQPGPGEVELRVHASGLNFRDVLNALGMYPGDPGPLGGECAGTVVAVGEGVENVRVGDEVMALGMACFSTFVTTKADFVAKMPSGFSFNQSATIPTTFLTAHYGLHHLAKIKPGDKVLVHAAAGGVGIAAVQLVQQASGEVFATASPPKWEFVKSLGVKHVMNSRTLDFADEIMKTTNGEGVDIVLNALADDFITKSFDVLKPNGRFLEIGKRGIWTQEQVDGLGKNIAYFPYDLGQVMHDEPERIAAMYDDLTPHFGSGALQSLPEKVFALDEAKDAFRFMAQAKHIGKIVLTQNVSEKEVNEPTHIDLSAKNVVAAREDGSYLITGGLGALGLEVAEWLIERGGKNVALMARDVAKADQAGIKERIEGWRENGAQVLVVQGDVSKREDVGRVIEEVERESGCALRGVFHAAGVLDDGALARQDWARFEKVMSPKTVGAWHLHDLTRDHELDFFVLFSSIASLFGSAGQGNYAAANAGLDALAHHRKLLGLPGLSINWGPWSEVGMAARMRASEQKRLSDQGLGMIPPSKGVEALEIAMTQNLAQVGILPVSWRAFAKQFPGGEKPSFFAEISEDAFEAETETQKPQEDAALLQELEAASPDEAREILEKYVEKKAVEILALDASDGIDPKQPLSELGLDSLMAVELQNALAAALGRKLPPSLMFDYPAIDQLVDYLLAKELKISAEQEPDADKDDSDTSENRARTLQEVQSLSEEEVDDSLAQELADLEEFLK